MRAEQKRIRQDVKTRRLTLQDLMTNPPEALKPKRLLDVIVMCQHEKRHPQQTIAAMGFCAMEDRINLAISLGDADARTRAWVADYDPWETQPPEDHHA
jgi:hypothetical protein